VSEQALQAGEVLTPEEDVLDHGAEGLYVCRVKEVFGRTFTLMTPVSSLVFGEYREGQILAVAEADVATIQQLFSVDDGH
jgi:hypothetical protein